MIKPYSLKSGDTIGIVSTARKVAPNELSDSIDILNSWGLNVVTGKNLYHQYNQFSGTDQERLEDIQYMIDSQEIKAVICARGGYGTVRIIDQIDFTQFAKNPKWIAGYSDITVLHSHIHTYFEIETLHSTMPINFSTNSPEALESLRVALFGDQMIYKINTHHLNRSGIATGEIIGGNLSILHNLAGTNSDINTVGKVLFLEDLGEYLYHIDRMMYNLKKSGKLEHLAGLVIGAMTDMCDNTVKFGETAYQIIYRMVSEYNYPVCFNFPCGHIADNRTLIMGRKATLTVNDSVTLEFD